MNRDSHLVEGNVFVPVTSILQRDAFKYCARFGWSWLSLKVSSCAFVGTIALPMLSASSGRV